MDILCTQCQQINPISVIRELVEKNTGDYEHQQMRYITLGLAADIFSRSQSCSFCALVTRSFRQEWIQLITRSDLVSYGERRPLRDVSSGICYLVVFMWHNTVERLSIEASMPNSPEGFDVDLRLLVDDDTSQELKLGEEHRGRRVTGQFNPSVVREWMQLCRKEHGDHCSQPLNSLGRKPQNLRLVDVQSKKIVTGVSDEYIALSYVWGTGSALRTTSENYKVLEVEASLSLFADELPQTILDVMELVMSLGRRYLWVDSLCIIQDDPADKTEQILQMDAIYNSAEMTIVILANDSALSPLPRMHNEEKSDTQIIESVEGIQIAAAMPRLVTAIEQSPWNTRAWTYQEMLLSKRTMYVSRDQIYFSCSKSDRYEDCYAELSSLVTNPLHGYEHIVDNARSRRFGFYKVLAQRYMARRLSRASDGWNAFQGIASAFHIQHGWHFSACLPEDMLEIALLWYPAQRLNRREVEGLVFPTWSWVGWIGPIRYSGYQPFVQSYIKSLTIGDGHYFRPLAHKEKMAFEGRPSNSVPDPQRRLTTGESSISGNILRFDTDAAIFKIELQVGMTIPYRITAFGWEIEKLDLELVPYVIDSKGRRCGFILEPDISWLRDSDGQRAISREFILLSTSLGSEDQSGLMSPLLWMKNFDAGSTTDINTLDSRLPCYDHQHFAPGRGSLLDVMLVERGVQFVTRRAIGGIHRDAWNEAHPVRIEVQLA